MSLVFWHKRMKMSIFIVFENAYFTMIDIEKPVKLKQPEQGEEKIIYKVVNYNEETQRCYIEPTNLDLPIPPQELVSVDDIENI